MLLHRVDQLSKHLSSHIHMKKFQSSSRAVDLVERPVNAEELELLACIAKHYKIPHNIHRKR